MSNEKPTGKRVMAQDGFSSTNLQKGLSSANLQTALNKPSPPSPPAKPSPTKGNRSQGTAKK